MGGIVGRLFREFAVTLAVAIAVSAVVSLTLTPMMCSRLLRPEPPLEQRGWFYRGSEKVFDAILSAYATALRWVLAHRTLVLILTVLAVALNVALFVVVPKGLFPQQDTGLLIGFSEAPQDVSFPSMQERQSALNAVVMSDPDVDHAISSIGAGPGGSQVNTGSVFIALKPMPPRKSSADEVIARLRPKLAKVEGVNLFLQSVQDVRVGGRSARTQYQYTVQAADLNDLRTWAPRILERMKKLPELKDVASDQQTAGLELDVDVDRDTASRLGLTFGAIDGTLYDSFGQRQVATTYTQLNQYRVVLETKPELQQGPEALDRVWIKSASGAMVPLAAVAKTRIGATPLAINHQGQFPSVTISFNLAPGKSLGQAVDAMHKAEREIGLPPSVHADFQGTAQAFAASLSSQPLLILTALLAVYVVLGMLYESYVHPITILSTLPSAGIGALLALMLFKVEFSIIGLIGIILLIGIVKKNAILMIDFAIEAERTENLTAKDAIYKACVLRFRPILMTTMAALLGGLPLALGGGIGSELRKPLGITIVGGLIVSQMLTLFTTPVIYLAFERLTKRDRELRRAQGTPSIRGENLAPAGE